MGTTVAPARAGWSGLNTLVTVVATLFLVGGIEVVLFGTVWTHGVYGSRMAWLFGVAVPLLVVAAVLAWVALRLGRSDAPPDHPGSRDPRRAPRLVGLISLVLIGVPLMFFSLVLLAYGLIFVLGRLGHWL